MSVNLKLKGIRVGFNYTQAQLAKELGISENAYNFKERGTRPFTQSEMEAIRVLFEFSPEEFVDVFFNSRVSANETISAIK